jgi:hypothetical protein
MKFHNWVQNFEPGFKISCPGTKLHNRICLTLFAQDFNPEFPGANPLILRLLYLSKAHRKWCIWDNVAIKMRVKRNALGKITMTLAIGGLAALSWHYNEWNTNK